LRRRCVRFCAFTLLMVVGNFPKHELSGQELVTQGIGDVPSKAPQDKKIPSVGDFHISCFHWIDELSETHVGFRDTRQLFQLMAKMPVAKALQIINRNLSDLPIFQDVNRSRVERSHVMDFVAIAAIKESITQHGIHPGQECNELSSRDIPRGALTMRIRATVSKRLRTMR
jgi:hypothetical protein